MRADLLALAVATVASALAPQRADACSISLRPAASFFGSTAGEPGRRPWIALWNVKDGEAVTLNVVTDKCDPKVVCKGKPAAFERAGKYLRPTADLPAGARVQLVLGTGQLVAETTITKSAASALPVWSGIEVVKVSATSNAMCAAGGPEVALKVKPTKSKLDNTVGLFYLSRPDAKAPHKGVMMIYPLGDGTDVMLNNHFDHRWLTGTGPTELWVLLADDAGNVGAPIKLI